MRVKHGAKFRAVVSAGDTVLETSEVDAELLGAHLTVTSYKYNADISGGCRWWNPATGQRLARAPRVAFELIDPTDELVGDQLCDCAHCLADEAAAVPS